MSYQIYLFNPNVNTRVSPTFTGLQKNKRVNLFFSDAPPAQREEHHFKSALSTLFEFILIKNHAQRTWYCFSPPRRGRKVCRQRRQAGVVLWHYLKFEPMLFFSTFFLFLVFYIFSYHFGIQANCVNTITWCPKMITPQY